MDDFDFDTMSAEQRIIRARIQLQKKQPFFGYILMHMSARESKSCPTMGVDKNGRMVFNRDMVMRTPEDELEGCISHESLHVVFQHMKRCGGRDKALFNVASDAVVNYMINNSGLKLPDWVLMPHGNSITIGSFYIDNLDKKTAEHVYDELYQQQKQQQKQGQGSGEGDEVTKGFDVHIYEGSGSGSGEDKDKDGKGGGSGDVKVEAVAGEPRSEREWRKVLSQAVTVAKARGTLPGGLERFADELLDQKVNWRHLLNKKIVSVLPFDFTWRRPSKKSYGCGYYLPSVVKENVEIIASVDVSGSISQEDLTEFLSEIVHIGRSFSNLKATIIFFDSMIHEVYDVTNGQIEDIMSYKITGGGGTDHRPVFKWVEENKPDVKLVIHFTDGYSNFGEDIPEYDNLWILSKNSVPEDVIPFGDVIKLEEDEE